MSTPDPRTEAADKITTEILEEMSAKGDTLWYRREELEGIIRDALTTEAARVRRECEARKDAAYLERNQVVAALSKCFPSGVARTAIEGWSEDWHGCVYIDLPTGQVSWHFHDSQAHLFAHLPPYRGTWDGHTTELKYERVAALTSTKPSQWSTARPTVAGWYWWRDKAMPLSGKMKPIYVSHQDFVGAWGDTCEWCPIARPGEEG